MNTWKLDRINCSRRPEIKTYFIYLVYILRLFGACWNMLLCCGKLPCTKNNWSQRFPSNWTTILIGMTARNWFSPVLIIIIVISSKLPSRTVCIFLFLIAYEPSDGECKSVRDTVAPRRPWKWVCRWNVYGPPRGRCSSGALPRYTRNISSELRVSEMKATKLISLLWHIVKRTFMFHARRWMNSSLILLKFPNPFSEIFRTNHELIFIYNWRL